MTDAARCDGRCNALRWPLQRAAFSAPFLCLARDGVAFAPLHAIPSKRAVRWKTPHSSFCSDRECRIQGYVADQRWRGITAFHLAQFLTLQKTDAPPDCPILLGHHQAAGSVGIATDDHTLLESAQTHAAERIDLFASRLCRSCHTRDRGGIIVSGLAQSLGGLPECRHIGRGHIALIHKRLRMAGQVVECIHSLGDSLALGILAGGNGRASSGEHHC